MHNFFRQGWLNLVLSVLVLAWGILPPGVRHAHVGGGDSTHRHDAGQTVAHHGPHDHDSVDGHDADHAHHSGDGNHQHETGLDVSLSADCVVHLHWRLLGIEFSMPVSQEPADGEDDVDTGVPAIVRMSDELVPVARAGPSVDRVCLSHTCTPSADVVRDLAPVSRPTNLDTSIPLCDSARLERSGVLLA
jgi:hypothetical protein